MAVPLCGRSWMPDPLPDHAVMLKVCQEGRSGTAACACGIAAIVNDARSRKQGAITHTCAYCSGDVATVLRTKL